MTPQELEPVLQQVLTGALHNTLWLAVLVSAVVALGATFLGSYLQAKGHHLATKEDLAELTRQVAATTKATEEIRIQITQTAWVEQRRWELKRELYTDLMKGLYRMRHVFERLIELERFQSNVGGQPTPYLDSQVEKFSAIF